MFMFGHITLIDPVIGTVAMIFVVLFIIFFEYVVDLVNLIEEGSPSTFHMIQKVFKELMNMGLVSFIIVMFETSRYATSAENVVLAVDYSHILLFFTVIYYVLHAFILIRLSEYISIQYEQTHFRDIHDILEEFQFTHNNKKKSFINKIRYLLGFHVYWKVEFRMLGMFFVKSFGLPEDFAFSDYLTTCFQQYVIKLLNIGPLTWMTVLVLVLINYIRLKVFIDKFTCTDQYMMPGANATTLTSSITAGASSHDLVIPISCADSSLHTYLVGGAALVVIMVGMLILSRIYELRYKNTPSGYDKRS